MIFKKIFSKHNLIIFLILLILLASRLWLLDTRPLHHDEGVNGYFENNLFFQHYYKYDPSNYHGPFFYYISLMGYLLFGGTIFGLRIMAAVFGVLIIFLLLPLKKFYKTLSFFVVLLFFLFSPSLSYYSRYAIHEIFFVFFILAFYVSLIYFFDRKNPNFLYAAATALGLSFATKETAYAAAFIFFSYFILADIFSLLRKKEVFYFNLAKKFRKELFYSFLLFLLVIVLFYSNFLQNLSGGLDILKSLKPWFSVGTANIQGHNKPFPYFLKLLTEYEWPILLFGTLGIIYCLIKRKNGLLVWWGFWTVAAYSLIPYKTPWLVINLTLPLILLSGWGAMFLSESGIKRIFLYFLLAISIPFLFWQNIRVNFLHSSEDAKNKYAYAHTTDDIKWVMRDIEKSGYKKIALVGKPGESYWPFPFYLRNYSVTYGIEEENINAYGHDYEVLIATDTFSPSLEIEKKFQEQKFQLRPNMWMRLYILQK